jgi:hypothetical protein
MLCNKEENENNKNCRRPFHKLNSIERKNKVFRSDRVNLRTRKIDKTFRNFRLLVRDIFAYMFSNLNALAQVLNVM